MVESASESRTKPTLTFAENQWRENNIKDKINAKIHEERFFWT